MDALTDSMSNFIAQQCLVAVAMWLTLVFGIVFLRMGKPSE